MGCSILLSFGEITDKTAAKIHGYDYKFVHTTKWPNGARDDPWPKIPALREVLKQYRMVIMIDADAIFRHLEIPFEWLLNRWNFTSETSMAMALDVKDYMNEAGDYTGSVGYTNNKYGELNPNAGFIMAQNNARTFDMLDAWISCPVNERDFPGCGRFAHGWPCEQGAFGEHIRYAFNRSTDFLAVACDDGMGFSNQGMDCKGRFVSHYTTGKHWLKNEVSITLLQAMLEGAHAEIMDVDSGIRLETVTEESVDEKYWHQPVPARPNPADVAIPERSGLTRAETFKKVELEEEEKARKEKEEEEKAQKEKEDAEKAKEGDDKPNDEAEKSKEESPSKDSSYEPHKGASSSKSGDGEANSNKDDGKEKPDDKHSDSEMKDEKSAGKAEEKPATGKKDLKKPAIDIADMLAEALAAEAPPIVGSSTAEVHVASTEEESPTKPLAPAEGVAGNEEGAVMRLRRQKRWAR